MAGGGGTRLWPLSRQDNPKQFLDLGTGKTLLEHTYDRATTLADPSDIYVATVKQYEDKTRQLLPQVPAENLFFEPERRDTAPAFAAAAIQLKLKGKSDQPTLFMWSDHVFTKEDEFLKDLGLGSKLLEDHPESVVIIGHTPTAPETGFGYIQVDKKLEGHDNVYKVKAFKEKPDLETAEKYVADGNYFWNMAYITIKPDYLFEQLDQHAPELMQGIKVFEEAIKAGKEKEANKAYADLPKLAIDYALLEKTPNILAVSGDYGWSDVGNWGAVQEIFGQDGDHMPAGHHIHVDSQNNYIYNTTDKVISLIGMEDTIAVVTDDAILVTNKNNSHRVKDVVSKLEEEDKSEYL